MKAYSVNPQTRELKEVNIEIQANTAYTFFRSISIDESEVIKSHVVYGDANAINAKKKPFFIGGQLIVGDALVLGREDFIDMEATIYKDELEELISYDVSRFYVDVLTLLASTELNLYRTLEAKVNDEKVSLNAEWVLSTFNIADDRTKEYFIAELEKVVNAKESVEEYMKKMAGLALNAAS